MKRCRAADIPVAVYQGNFWLLIPFFPESLLIFSCNLSKTAFVFPVFQKYNPFMPFCPPVDFGLFLPSFGQEFSRILLTQFQVIF